MSKFNCEYCDKEFSLKTNLTRHLNRKTTCYERKKKLTCNICNIEFSTLSNLNAHLKTKKHLKKSTNENKKIDIPKNVPQNNDKIIDSSKNKVQNKKVSIPKVIRNLVWDTHIGEDNGSGPCYVCTKKINSKDFECGHIIAESKGGTTDIENLRPVCRTCNGSIGSKNMDEFKKKYFNKK
jgi:uncharacterized Zn-finger protein